MYEDRTTHSHANLGCVSHIVAASPDGPRGDPVRSPQLARDIKNLMLTCLEHGRLIDDKAQVRRYPESRLLEYKAEHEVRVRMVTAVSGATFTEVLIVKVPLDGGRDAEIGEEVFDAILPDFPLNEVPRRVDLTDLGRVVDAATVKKAADSLRRRIRHVLRTRQEEGVTAGLSVFAIAPISLLVYLGSQLGDLVAVRVFQRQRDRDNWMWKPDVADGQEEIFEVRAPDDDDDDVSGEVVLAVDVSARVPDSGIGAVLPGSRRYRLSAVKPSVDFLQRRQQVTVFGIQIRDVLDRVARENSELKVLHVFAAVPTPIAIELGRHLRVHIPQVQMYEYKKEDRSYWASLDFVPADVGDD